MDDVKYIYGKGPDGWWYFRTEYVTLKSCNRPYLRDYKPPGSLTLEEREAEFVDIYFEVFGSRW